MKVPSPLKSDVWAAYRSAPRPKQEFLLSSEAYALSLAKAIEHVALIEGRSLENIYRRMADRLTAASQDVQNAVDASNDEDARLVA